MDNITHLDLCVSEEDVAYSETGLDILPGSGLPKDEARETKRSKQDKKQVSLLSARIYTGKQACYSKHAHVTLECHHLGHEDVVIVSWQHTILFKVTLVLDDRQRDVFTVVHHKNLESQIAKAARGPRKNKNKSRARDDNSTRRLISKPYKDIACSEALLSYEDASDWQLTLRLSLNYVPQSLNKFSKETCSFLDRMFSRKSRRTWEAQPTQQSPFIQKDFIQQTVSYTQHNVDSKEATATCIDGLRVNLLPFQSKSVSWMMGKEQELLPEIDLHSPAEILRFLNDFVSFGYEMVSSTVFWNKFTNFILTCQEVLQIYENFQGVKKGMGLIGSKGLLSEEMGLGKTIEILALILQNKRPAEKDGTFIDNDGKTIYKTKTTLIICPNAILQQWINEIESQTTQNMKIFHYKGFLHVKKYFNCENIQEIVNILSDCDIIITSYNVVSMEIHYAEYNASLRPRRTISPIKYDYSSPLSLMQFFRIILDEVQMLHSDSTKAAKCTSLLHRVHTWGVSGTPIQLIRDYQTVLSYLKISPFFELPEIIAGVNLNVIYKRGELINGISFNLKELMKFFIERNLCIRHSRQDVLDQIQIPQQHNILVPLEFAPIEWDNYLDLWNNFIQASGYGPNGSGSTRLSNIQLNQWLTRLRYLCCHAIFPEHNSNSKNNPSSNSNPNSNLLHNIDDVLKLMTSDAEEKLDALYRDNYQLQIKSAQAKMELQDNPRGAIDMLNLVKENLLHDLRKKCHVDDPFNTSPLSEDTRPPESTKQSLENDSRMRTRAYLDLLHQSYFFIATGYYLMGSSKLEKIDHENEKIALLERDVKPKTYTDSFTAEEMAYIEKNQQLEQEYYSYAEKLRERMLIGRVQKAESIIKETKRYFNSPDGTNRPQALLIIPFDQKDDYSSNILVSRCFKMLASLVESLNNQAIQFNELFSELRALLYKPILNGYDKEDIEEKANEYSTSIDDQDKMFSIFACLEQLLLNRDLILTSDEAIKNPKKSLKPQAGKQLSGYHGKLISKLFVISGSPMKQVFDDLKNSRIVRNVSGSSSANKSSDDFEDYLLEYEEKMNRMTRENNIIRESLKRINNIYNAKLEYYSHLQKISDSLVSLLQLENSTRNSILKSVRNGTQNQQNLEKIGSAESRVKYLNSLYLLKEGIGKKKSFQCPICLGTIHMGAIIKCGHFFCRKCIGNWLQHHNTCPMCKINASMMELYNFKFQNEDKDTYTPFEQSALAQQASSSKKFDSETKSYDSDPIFREKYSLYPQLKEVHKMLIKESFGAKIDCVVKLLLFLKMKSEAENEDPPQVVLYSQSFDFLRVISKVLHIHDISQLTCISNVSNIGETISKFKKDKTITCLLLNVKALGAGLNLLNARHVFLLDPIINQGDELQAMSRNNRIGQTEETYVWNFMIRNSVEENILKHKCILESKRKTKGSNRMPTQDLENVVSTEEERTEFEMNESTGEQVAGKHLWDCFF